MDIFVEKLINKRLGIGKDDIINESMIVGDYYHIASVIDSIKSKILPLSYGVNTCLFTRTIHAECDAINHLPPRGKNNRLKIIHLVVIRTTKYKKISNSKPCVHCINQLCKQSNRKGYHINKIYYSDYCGEIIESSLDELKLNTTHISRFYRNLNQT